MDCNKDEVARVKDLAERKLLDKNFVGAKKLIIKAQQLSKEVGDIDIQKMLTVCDVHCAAGAKKNVPIDWYGILQVPETADEAQIKKQYHKLALLLHPDKNKFGGAEAAFKLVGEANKTLTDRSKRSLYDMRRVTATRRTFWTMCPSCGTRYQHYIVVLKKALCCQSCLKQFIARDLTEQAESSESSISETSSDNEVVESRECSMSETSSDEEEIADHGPAANGSGQGQRSRQLQEVQYNEEKVDDDFVNSPSLKRLRKSGMFCGDDNKKMTKLVEEIAGHNGMTDGANNCSTTEDEREGGSSIHGLDLNTNNASDVAPQGDTLRFSHYVPHHVVSETEKEGIPEKSLELDPAALSLDFEGEGDFRSIIPESSSCKGSMNVEEGQHTTCMDPGITAETPREKGRKHDTCSSEVAEVTDVDEDSICQTIYVHAESEFCDFSQRRLLQKFSPGKIWALYSAEDNFPNYYGFIEKVDLKNGEVQVRWLDVCPHGEEEKRLLQGEGTIGCGIFRLSHELNTYTNTDAFSQCVDARSTSQKGEYEIIPHVGEIWAVYKNWRVGWTAQDFGRCEYELVEILGHTGCSIRVQPLSKVIGYETVFVPCRAEGSVKTIRRDEYPKFSHQIPCFRLTCEKGGKLQGCLELDPLSLPEEFLNVNSQHNTTTAGLSSGNSACKGSMNVGEGQHTTCLNAGIASETPKEESRKHNTCSVEVDEGQTIYVHAESEFYDFSQKRLLQKFLPGKIWALYSDKYKFPNYYGFIQKVDVKNGKVQVRWLDVCPHGEEEKRLLQEDQTIGCGTFRLSHELMTYTNIDVFSQCVDAISTSQKGEYEIIPHLGEIWAVYKNWRVGWTAQDFGRCEYELVEILGYTSSIRVQVLRKVDGYRMVFMPYEAEGSVKTIRKDEYPKFSHQIPCFRLTCEKGGKLQGCLELDPLSLPEEFLNVNSQHNTTTAGLSSGNSACKGSMNVGKGQHTTCLNAGIAAETPKEESRKHNTCSVEVDEGQTICVHAESEFYDFSQKRLLQKFLPGKIWALYSDKDNFPNYYGFIQKVDVKNGKVQVRWLDVCPHGEEEKRLLQEDRTIGCGTFRLSNELVTYTNIDVFSQCVDAISTSQKGEYEIIPHLGEIWAVYKNWRVGWTAQDFERCEYELVEILGYTGSSIRVQVLRKVDGYRMVFIPYEAEGSVKTIRKDEYPKFSHQIPCFRLTCEKGGKLRHCLELDPLSLPEEFLNVR